MKTFVCEICRKTFPESLRHEHHKVPKALGGSDGPENLVSLCHADHNNLHLLAYMMINPKRSHEVEPTVVSIFPDAMESRRRLIEFSKIVAKEMALKKEIKKDPMGETRVVVELPTRYAQLLRLAGYESPAANGRPAGVARMIRQIVAKYLMHKFPTHRDEILNLFKKKSRN